MKQVKCFKCDTELKPLCPETNQFHDAVEFKGEGAFGSSFDLIQFTIQICDDCIKAKQEFTADCDDEELHDHCRYIYER